MSEVMAVLFAEVSGSGLIAVVGIGAAVGLVVFLVGMRARSQLARNSKEVIILVVAPYGSWGG